MTKNSMKNIKKMAQKSHKTVLKLFLKNYPNYLETILSYVLAPGESPVRIHQEGDGRVPAVRAGLPAGEAADSALQPPDGSVSADQPAHAAGGTHPEPQAQTLGAERVLHQGR